jgi:uncharacterized protein
MTSTPIDPRIAEIAKAFGLNLIIMYGSRARGQARSTSDTDIAVRSSQVIPMEQQFVIAQALDKVYPEVEVCDVRQASPLLLAAIAQDAKLLFEAKPSSFEEFKIFAYNQYLDYKPVLDKQRELNRKMLKEL